MVESIHIMNKNRQVKKCADNCANLRITITPNKQPWQQLPRWQPTPKPRGNHASCNRPAPPLPNKPTTPTRTPQNRPRNYRPNQSNGVDSARQAPLSQNDQFQNWLIPRRLIMIEKILRRIDENQQRERKMIDAVVRFIGSQQYDV